MSIPATTIQQFDCSPMAENLGPKWTAWVKRLEQFFASNKITDDAQQLNALFFLAGEHVHQIHETLGEITVPNTVATEYGKAESKFQFSVQLFVSILFSSNSFSAVGRIIASFLAVIYFYNLTWTLFLSNIILLHVLAYDYTKFSFSQHKKIVDEQVKLYILL